MDDRHFCDTDFGLLKEAIFTVLLNTFSQGRVGPFMLRLGTPILGHNIQFFQVIVPSNKMFRRIQVRSVHTFVCDS